MLFLDQKLQDLGHMQGQLMASRLCSLQWLRGLRHERGDLESSSWVQTLSWQRNSRYRLGFKGQGQSHIGL